MEDRIRGIFSDTNDYDFDNELGRWFIDKFVNDTISRENMEIILFLGYSIIFEMENYGPLIAYLKFEDLKYFIEIGKIDINIRLEDGENLFFRTTMIGCEIFTFTEALDEIEYLLNKGLDPNQKNIHGNKFIHTITEGYLDQVNLNEYRRFIHILMTYNIDLESTDYWKRNILDIFYEYKPDSEIIGFLRDEVGLVPNKEI